MDQADFWQQCEQAFLRYGNEENEKLVVRWDAKHGDAWSFEGSPDCAREFKALAQQSGAGLTRKLTPDAWKDWLDALRENGYDSRVTQTSEALAAEKERQARGLIAELGRRKPGSLAASFLKRAAATGEKAMLSFEAFSGIIKAPFRKSALLCREKGTEALFTANQPDEPVNVQDFADLLNPLLGSVNAESEYSLRMLGEDITGEMPSRLKPGPPTDYETASRVAQTVAEIVAESNWRSRLDELCDALDDKKIPRPKTWRKRNPPIGSWADAATTDRDLAKKAIAHHLKIARG